MKTTERVIDTFTAEAENGTHYTISLIQEFQTSTYLSGETSTIEGMKRYTCGRYTVSPLGNDTFHILNIDTKVKKVA